MQVLLAYLVDWQKTGSLIGTITGICGAIFGARAWWVSREVYRAEVWADHPRFVEGAFELKVRVANVGNRAVAIRKIELASEEPIREGHALASSQPIYDLLYDEVEKTVLQPGEVGTYMHELDGSLPMEVSVHSHLGHVWRSNVPFVKRTYLPWLLWRTLLKVFGQKATLRKDGTIQVDLELDQSGTTLLFSPDLEGPLVGPYDDNVAAGRGIRRVAEIVPFFAASHDVAAKKVSLHWRDDVERNMTIDALLALERELGDLEALERLR